MAGSSYSIEKESGRSHLADYDFAKMPRTKKQEFQVVSSCIYKLWPLCYCIWNKKVRVCVCVCRTVDVNQMTGTEGQKKESGTDWRSWWVFPFERRPNYEWSGHVSVYTTWIIDEIPSHLPVFVWFVGPLFLFLTGKRRWMTIAKRSLRV